MAHAIKKSWLNFFPLDLTVIAKFNVEIIIKKTKIQINKLIDTWLDNCQIDEVEKL